MSSVWLPNHRLKSTVLGDKTFPGKMPFNDACLQEYRLFNKAGNIKTRNRWVLWWPSLSRGGFLGHGCTFKALLSAAGWKEQDSGLYLTVIKLLAWQEGFGVREHLSYCVSQFYIPQMSFCMCQYLLNDVFLWLRKVEGRVEKHHTQNTLE